MKAVLRKHREGYKTKWKYSWRDAVFNQVDWLLEQEEMNIGENYDSWQINPIEKLLFKLIFFLFPGFLMQHENTPQQNNKNNHKLNEYEEFRASQAV